MIERGTFPEEKCNQYAGGTYDNLYGHPTFKFYDMIADESVQEVIKHFNDLGYGCEIQRAKTITLIHNINHYNTVELFSYSMNDLSLDLCNKIINATELNSDYGTMYLWFVENENDINLMKEISWQEK